MKIEAKKGRKSIELKIDLKSSGYDMDYFKNSIECIMRYAYVDSFFFKLFDLKCNMSVTLIHLCGIKWAHKQSDCHVSAHTHEV